eukprot:Rmarinus@m.16883
MRQHPFVSFHHYVFFCCFNWFSTWIHSSFSFPLGSMPCIIMMTMTSDGLPFFLFYFFLSFLPNFSFKFCTLAFVLWTLFVTFLLINFPESVGSSEIVLLI